MICFREVLERAGHKLSDDGTSVMFVSEQEEDQLVGNTGEEDHLVKGEVDQLVKDIDDTTCHPVVIDQTDLSSVNHEPFRMTNSNLASDCGDLWTLDESPVEWPKQFCVNGETWSIDQGLRQSTETLAESNEHGLGSDTQTLYELDEDLRVSGDAVLPKPVSYASLRCNCRALSKKALSAATYGQFSDAEDDGPVELITGTSGRAVI